MAILPSLAISSSADLSSRRLADLVIDVWRASLVEDAEMEYAELNGLVHITRATQDKGLDHELKLANNNAEPTWMDLGEVVTPLKAIDLAHADGCIWAEQTRDASFGGR
jgi:hypothetical protein